MFIFRGNDMVFIFFVLSLWNLSLSFLFFKFFIKYDIGLIFKLKYFLMYFVFFVVLWLVVLGFNRVLKLKKNLFSMKNNRCFNFLMIFCECMFICIYLNLVENKDDYNWLNIYLVFIFKFVL